MKILVTGSTGLIGEELCSSLIEQGHKVLRAKRNRRQMTEGDVFWEPESGYFDAGALRGVEAVFHLAGENIAGGRWNKERKQRIRDSRIVATRALAETLAALPDRPRVMISASAVGFYGDSHDRRLDEGAPAGEGFLAEVANGWEEALNPAREAGIRVVQMRLGAVLSPKGGALKAMLLPFKLGVGGRMGSGQQYMGWIGLPDAVRSFIHALHHDELEGPVNAVAPQELTNSAFTRALGRAVRRPTLIPMPAMIARIVIGEMAEELLLASMRVIPDKLIQSGFKFRHPLIDDALESLLGTKSGQGPITMAAGQSGVG